MLPAFQFEKGKRMFKAKDVIFTFTVCSSRWVFSSALAVAFSASVLTGADSWQPRTPVPGPRAAHSAVWTGREMIVWGGGVDGQFLNTGARYNPATDTWRVTSPSNAPSPRWFQAAVWTGSEMIIWGGRANFFGVNNYNDGARYNPSTDRWTGMSTHGAPSPRSQCAAVWTGSEMIIWGGETDDGIELNDGARYNPETDTWAAISNGSGLEPRMEPTGIWTGEEFIVFGGMKFTGGQLSFGNGARYSPATDSWAPLPGVNSPGSRSGHTAVWTGERMIVWGGRMVPEQVALNTGASFDPGANLWSPLPVTSALPVRMYHAAVWTGTEMIVWGGQTIDGTMLNTGARYKPALRAWTTTTQDGAPRQRQFWRPDLGVWTGSGMLICGGSDYPASVDSTALYIPGGSAPPPEPDVLIQFEPPSLPHGSKLINSWNEQGFSFTTGSGEMAHTDNGVSDNVPQNGSAYLQFLFGDKPLLISNLTGRPFALKRVDLAEYSTVFPVPKTVTFTGYYPDGSSVVQAFTTDGAIGGNNPGPDFETFTFPSSFRGLVRVEVTPDVYSLDNLLVSVGTNVPPPPPPPPPASGHDLSRDFSPAQNPNGVWSYGYQTTLGGAFTLLTFPLTSYGDNPVPVNSWSKNGYEPVAVYHNGTTNTSISDGGAGTFPPGTTWFYPGVEGHADNYGVIRFTVPSGRTGTYQLKTEVRAYLDGPRSGDTDFHVLKNGVELFGEAVPGNSGTSYSNRLSLVEGDTVDFAVGRGRDGIAYDSGLKIRATLTLATNTPPPPPPPPASFDLSRDYSLAANPNGPWTYGYLTALGSNGFFGPLGASRTFGADNGVPIGGWELTTYQLPGVWKVLGPGVAHSDGDHFTAEPGTVYFAPGADGAPQNFGVVRFTVPVGAGGLYRLETAVRSLFDGSRSRDADFHVLKNGQQLFGRFLEPNSSTGYSNVLVLAAGDRVDFAIGRGVDGTTYDTGLKIRATLTLATNAPPPPPPSEYDVARDYSMVNNPNGPWSYGWKGTPGGDFTPITYPYHFSADNGVPLFTWLLSATELPGVSYVVGPGTAVSAGGQFVAEPGTLYFTAGADGTPYNFGAVRFRVPAGQGGNYRLETSVRDLFDGFHQGDTDFHVVRNGLELFGQFIPVHATAGYSNVLALAEGDTIDLLVGRGQDGHQAGSGLKLLARLTRTPVPPVPPPPPLPPGSFDLSRDYSLAGNPNGPWTYGYLTALSNGTFGVLADSRTFTADNGVPIAAWELTTYQIPGVWKVMGPGTAHSDGDHFTAEPGTVYFAPGADGAPQNFGVIRFTVPAGADGSYRLQTSVRSLFDGDRSHDADFHVLKNGQELFGQFLPPNSGATYSNVLVLASGDQLDFVIGRGADGLTADTGLKIQASLAPLPRPPRAFDLSNDFTLETNPNGPWSYGHASGTPNGDFTLITTSRTFGAENGVPIAIWQLIPPGKPWVAKVLGPETAVSSFFEAPAGTVYFGPDPDATPEDFGVIRFTTPTNGVYRLETAVRTLYDGPRSADADFYVLRNGVELFNAALEPNSGTAYTNLLILTAGDVIDFVAGRGANARADTGLKIHATLFQLGTLPPRPPPEPPIHCVPSPAGLVGWWPAEGNANDVIGTNSGTLFGGASYVTGRVSRAFAFSGTNGGVKIPASPSLDVGSGGGLTIEGWINPATLSVRGPLVEWNRGGPGAIEWGAHLYILHPEEFGLGAGNLVANLTESDGTWHFLMAPGGTVQANTWQHVAVTYDKASGEGRLYRNGEVVAAGNLGSFTPETRYDLYLGRRPAGEGVLSYQGLLDEISIYSRALSAAEIAGIAGAGGAGKCRVPAELEQLVARVLELSSPIETPLLLASLEAVRTSIARGNLLSAIQQLLAFQTQVSLLVGPVDLALAEELAEVAQKAIDALDPTGVRRVMFVAASEAPLRLKRCVLTPVGAICVEGTGAPGANCWVQRSTNLANWEPIGCAIEIDDGEFEFIDANPPAGPARFYRLYSP